MLYTARASDMKLVLKEPVRVATKLNLWLVYIRRMLLLSCNKTKIFIKISFPYHPPNLLLILKPSYLIFVILMLILWNLEGLYQKDNHQI